MIERFEENAKVFKAFCDVNRLMILEMLQSGEKCACVILEEMRIVQSTLSHHMKINSKFIILSNDAGNGGYCV